MILLHHKFYFCLSQCSSGCHILADSQTTAEITTLLNKTGSYFHKTNSHLRLGDITYYLIIIRQVMIYFTACRVGINVLRKAVR
jgi:hypothetical protein